LLAPFVELKVCSRLWYIMNTADQGEVCVSTSVSWSGVEGRGMPRPGPHDGKALTPWSR
jgi:hypothetical protein